MRGYFRTVLRIVSIFFIIFSEGIHADDELPSLSVRPEVQKRTIDTFAEVLYWHTSETVDWAFTIDHHQNSLKDTFKTLVFDWAPGFRIGMGYHTDYDQWDTRVGYTMFQSKAKDNAQGAVTSGFLAPKIIPYLQPFSTGRVRLNLNYHMFDWDIGHGFLTSTCLFLRPSIGLKGGWITQTIHSSWTNPDYLLFLPVHASENLKQVFKGGGPKCALAMKWYIENSKEHFFSLMGQFEAGYLWGHWSIRDKFFDNYFTVINVKTSERNFGSFMVHSFIGCGWDYAAKSDRLQINMKLGYEIEDWFNHCQIFTNTSGSQKNDLILQGFNFSLNFAF